MKSIEIKQYNLPQDRFLVDRIDAKPNYLFGLLIIFGIFLLGYNTASLFGFIVIAFGVACIVFMPNVVLMEFYDNYLVMFNKANKNTCFLVYYNEVASWYYSWSANKDFLNIELIDGSVIKIEAFSKPLFESKMNRFLKDKHKKNNKDNKDNNS